MIYAGFLGGPELIVIAAVVLLMFGGKKLPELMRGLGKGVKEFKDATKADDIEKEISDISSGIKDATSDIKKSKETINKVSRLGKTNNSSAG